MSSDPKPDSNPEQSPQTDLLSPFWKRLSKLNKEYYVGGSYALYSILAERKNVTWRPHDLDIFFPLEEEKNMTVNTVKEQMHSIAESLGGTIRKNIYNQFYPWSQYTTDLVNPVFAKKTCEKIKEDFDDSVVGVVTLDVKKRDFGSDISNNIFDDSHNVQVQGVIIDKRVINKQKEECKQKLINLKKELEDNKKLDIADPKKFNAFQVLEQFKKIKVIDDIQAKGHLEPVSNFKDAIHSIADIKALFQVKNNKKQFIMDEQYIAYAMNNQLPNFCKCQTRRAKYAARGFSFIDI